MAPSGAHLNVAPTQRTSCLRQTCHRVALTIGKVGAERDCGVMPSLRTGINSAHFFSYSLQSRGIAPGGSEGVEHPPKIAQPIKSERARRIGITRDVAGGVFDRINGPLSYGYIRFCSDDPLLPVGFVLVARPDPACSRVLIPPALLRPSCGLASRLLPCCGFDPGIFILCFRSSEKHGHSVPV